MIDLILLLLIPTLLIALVIRYRKQVRWLLTPLIWFKNVIDPQWWAEQIFYKLKLDRLADNPYKRWLETLPQEKKIAIELGVGIPVLILMDHYILMPYFGMAMLPMELGLEWRIMDLDDQVKFGHLLLHERKCRTCGERKESYRRILQD